ncbi:hypothetical protein [Streptosporangium sp. NPDC004631]
MTRMPRSCISDWATPYWCSSSRVSEAIQSQPRWAIKSLRYLVDELI